MNKIEWIKSLRTVRNKTDVGRFVCISFFAFILRDKAVSSISLLKVIWCSPYHDPPERAAGSWLGSLWYPSPLGNADLLELSQGCACP